MIDVVEGNTSNDLGLWLDEQPGEWLDGIRVVATDLAESYRAGLAGRLDHATRVADPFHVVRVANRCLDKVRRRVQNHTTGHRGRKHDPLHKIRKVMLKGAERLDGMGVHRMLLGLRIGDPDEEVLGAWLAKEAVRDIYLTDDPADAEVLLDKAIEGCRTDPVDEIRSLGRTLTRWRPEIVNHHQTGAPNGPTEGLNLLVKKVKRAGHFGPTFEQILALPRDPVALAAQVRTWAATPTIEENGKVPVGEALDQREFRMLSGLAIDWPLPPDLRRPVGEALQHAPLVEINAGARDPNGRPAVRLQRTLDIHVPGVLRRNLYLAPGTLELLAYDDTVIKAPRGVPFLKPGDVRARGIFEATTPAPTLPVDLPATAVLVDGGPGFWQTGQQITCTQAGPRACSVLEAAGKALSRNESCPADPELRRWSATVTGVVDGTPVHVRWCGGQHAKPLLLATGPNTTFAATLTPIPAKSTAACAQTVTVNRRTAGNPPVLFPLRKIARRLCADAAHVNWYHARIAVTHGDAEIVSCFTTARDASDTVLFQGRLGFGFAGMFGNLAVEPRRPAEFDWYAAVATDQPPGATVPTTAAVTAYTTECVPNALPAS